MLFIIGCPLSYAPSSTGTGGMQQSGCPDDCLSVRESVGHTSVCESVFYHAALYATRSFLWQTCLSVCLSVTRVNCDKTNESSADILTSYERKIHLRFRTLRMVGGCAPLYLKFWVKLTHPASKKATFSRYSLYRLRSYT